MQSFMYVCLPVCVRVCCFQVPGLAGLKEGPIVAAKKGQKPKPASGKGFGVQ
jgi:hypothetical protein